MKKFHKRAAVFLTAATLAGLPAGAFFYSSPGNTSFDYEEDEDDDEEEEDTIREDDEELEEYEMEGEVEDEESEE